MMGVAEVQDVRGLWLLLLGTGLLTIIGWRLALCCLHDLNRLVICWSIRVLLLVVLLL